jgi:hypothetical protein
VHNQNHSKHSKFNFRSRRLEMAGRFPLAGEPKPRNEAARMRVEALTIYDSQSHSETLLSAPGIDSRKATASGGAFALIMLIGVVGTYIILL